MTNDTILSAEAAAQPYKQARETQDEVDVLRAQRDELLAALEEFIRLGESGLATYDTAALVSALTIACAVVARCKEE